jgi:hypothetical protein
VLVISPVNFVADLQHARAYFEDQLREEEHTGGALRLTLWNQTAELLDARTSSLIVADGRSGRPTSTNSWVKSGQTKGVSGFDVR